MKKRYDNLIMGENISYSMDTNLTGCNNNRIIIGGTGEGKSLSHTVPFILHMNNTSGIFTFSKRQDVDKLMPYVKEKGYEIIDIDFVNMDNTNYGFDPMDYLFTERDIINLSTSLILSGKDISKREDAYFDEAAISLLSAEIAFNQECWKLPNVSEYVKENATFNDVIKFHQGLKFIEGRGGFTTSNYDNLFDLLEEIDPDSFAVSCFKTVSGLASRTVSCIYSTVNTALDKIFSNEVRELIVKNKKINIPKIGRVKTAVFITISPFNKSTSSFLNILYSSLFENLFMASQTYPNGELPISVHIICDDFACGGKINNFANLISIFRASKISCSLLLQDLSQLKYMYGEYEASTIINNCSTIIYMGGMDINTCREMSIRANKPIEEIMYMPIGFEYIFRRGQNPIYCRRYKTLEDDIYKDIFLKKDEFLLELE